MTADSKGAKKRIVVKRTKSSSKKSTPQKLPSDPSLTAPLSYGKTKKGKHIIPRFIVSENGKNYVVVDMETGNIAEKTSSAGYPFKEAKRIAKWFRKTYGLYTNSPF